MTTSAQRSAHGLECPHHERDIKMSTSHPRDEKTQTGYPRVLGFEDGAPAWICPVGMPRHGNYEPQTGTPPATLTLSASSYNPGDSITVTLTGGDIEGFLLRAHRASGANDTEEIVGEFTSWPTGVKPLVWMPQSGVTYNCLTQSDDDDLNNLVLTWQAPSTSVGDVVFKASVVTDYEIFWDNLVSSVLTASTAEPSSTYESTVSPDFSDLIFADACGTTKGCMMYPNGCKASDCEVVIAYTTINSQAAVQFEMFTAINIGYLSLGFSADRKMGEELTVNCMRSADTLYVEHAYNRPDYNIRQRINAIATVHGIFGIIATALMITNIIMGVVRPVKGKQRKIFNLAHRICGALTFVFTIVCLLLGTRVDLLHPEIQLTAAALIGVGFIIQVILEVILEIVCWKPSKVKASSPEDDKRNRLEIVKTAILSLYGVVMLVITIGVMYLVYTY
ncbi:hypothetical protein LSH36_115g13023 [Paralvinella palmiformis]|uniref:Reelin domain-containing protein n=1 Tax=Paralvinella palmiformis TaxID=53620 RepID=A0AAD9JYS5_9ANNE|nr:hypothetical protein LSH36_115g13023 [Paralvinella palmiformis]